MKISSVTLENVDTAYLLVLEKFLGATTPASRRAILSREEEDALIAFHLELGDELASLKGDDE